MSQSQRRIQDFFRTGDSTTPVTDSSTRGLTNTVEDLQLSTEGQALPRQNEAESQPGSETQSETDEFTDLHDTATSIITTSTSLCRMSCECQCCSNISTPHHPLVVDSSKKKQLYSSKQHGKQKSHSRTIQSSWYKAHPWISVHQNIKCIVQPAEQLLSKVC